MSAAVDTEMTNVEMEEKTADVDNVDESVSSGGAERQISLHPLVLFNISDHHTRCSNQGTNAPRVIGALFGIQNGLEVSVFDSFEMKHSIDPKTNEVVIDKEFLSARTQQFAQVFPGFELLGWYTIGNKTTPSDLAIHRAVMEFNESPFLLLLDAAMDSELLMKKKLPVALYESELHVLNGTPTMLFVKTPFKVDTSETESITVDHVSKVTPVGDSKHSSLNPYLGNVRDAVKMLNRQVEVLVRFLQAVREGQVAVDHQLLRQISSVCNELPAMSLESFDKAFMQEYNNAALVSYLAALTKATHNTNTVMERFAFLQERQHPRSTVGIGMP